MNGLSCRHRMVSSGARTSLGQVYRTAAGGPLPWPPCPSLWASAPLCAAVRSANAPGGAGGRHGTGFTGGQLYDYAFNTSSPCWRAFQGWPAAAVIRRHGPPDQRGVDAQKAQSRGLSTEDVAAAVRNSNALLAIRENSFRQFDANVLHERGPLEGRTIGESAVKLVNGKPVLIKDVARWWTPARPTPDG